PTAYGVCWNTTGTPTTADSNTDEGGTSSTGPFTSGMTGLTTYTIYYVRAYATNASGTAYGNEVTFLTSAVPAVITTDSITAIAYTTATGNGTIVDLGIPTPTAYGVCWNTAGTPTLADSYTDEGVPGSTGAFISLMTGLSQNTTYYVRAYASSPAATFGFSDDYDPVNWSFSSTLSAGDGSVDLSAVPSAITLNGSDNWTSAGDNDYEAYVITIPVACVISFDYSHVNPNIDDAYYAINSTTTQITTGGTGSVTGIAVNSGDVFEFRVYNYINCCGRGVLTISNFRFAPTIYYGNEISFITPGTTITTDSITDIVAAAATGNGTISELGSPTPTAHGVCWNTTGTPTITDSHTDEGAAIATGPFTSSMTGLSPLTTYYVRAYAGSSPFSQFTGDFDVVNWAFNSTTVNGDGSVNTSGAPASIILNGSDNGVGGVGSGQYEAYEITILQSGFISFDYDHVNPDIDDAYYAVNGTTTQITYSGSGSVTGIPVNSGDVFEFRVYNYDNCYGRGVLTISNFAFSCFYFGNEISFTTSDYIAQTITFDPFTSPVHYLDPDFTLTATASSSLPVSFSSSNPAVASVTGNTVDILLPGHTTITASQAGDYTYSAAPDVSYDLGVAPDMWDDPTYHYQATLNWNGYVGATNYKIAYAKVGTTTYGYKVTSGTSVTIAGLTPGTDYFWRVSPDFGAGWSYFSPADTFTTDAAPVLDAVSITQTKASLTWSGFTGATNYKIVITPVGSTSYIYKVSAASPYLITGLTPNTEYFWKITADYGSGWTTFTPADTFTTAAVPAPPVLTHNPVSYNQATLNWSGFTGAINYKVQYAPVGTTTYGYKVTTGSSVTIGALPPNQTYFWRVCADYGSGFTAYSAADTLTTTNPVLSATPVTTTSEDLGWTGIVGAVNYKIMYYKTGTTSYIYKLSAVPSISLTGLLSGTDYTWKVSADYGSGWTSYTPTATFTTNAAKYESITADMQSLSNVFIYPNPSGDKTTISFLTDGVPDNIYLKVLDLAGKEIMKTMFASQTGYNTYVLDITSLTDGMYLIAIQKGNEVIYNKFIKQY
ncbi:MAG: T9SS type A sorting domain-containing protein, partial [Bacteroidota bacterium]